jgi:hypothetical protein
MTLLAINRCIGNPMNWHHSEPTLTEILSDSIVKALMEADGVDPIALEVQLRGMAQDLTAVRDAGRWLQTD